MSSDEEFLDCADASSRSPWVNLSDEASFEELVEEAKAASLEDAEAEKEVVPAVAETRSVSSSSDGAEAEEEEEEELEEIISPEAMQSMVVSATALKEEGNTHFSQSAFPEAIQAYSNALTSLPHKVATESEASKLKAILLCNRAACHLSLCSWSDVVTDCDEALTCQPGYVKAVVRRATAYEQLEKLREALNDWKVVLESPDALPAMRNKARASIAKLEPIVKAKEEKEKEEMMGKLKDLGNMILGNFGLSTDNFQMVQDPNTGGYSVNFKQ